MDIRVIWSYLIKYEYWNNLRVTLGNMNIGLLLGDVFLSGKQALCYHFTIANNENNVGKRARKGSTCCAIKFCFHMRSKYVSK